MKIFLLFSVMFLFIQNTDSSEEVEDKKKFSGAEFFQETSDTLEPNIVMQHSLKRDVERRRSLEPITESNTPIMTQDACPHKTDPHSISKLKERKAEE